MVTAIDIETNLWNSVIDQLIKESWNLIYKYEGIDAGIDFNLLVLEKDGEQILFGWDNWVEGEIKCSEHRMNEIEKSVNNKFKRGDALNLKPAVVGLYWNESKRK